MWPPCGALRTLALARSRGARACSMDGGVSYTQGQSPEPRTREYFYYVDHQGQLFLDDSKMKNFITCFKGQPRMGSPAVPTGPARQGRSVCPRCGPGPGGLGAQRAEHPSPSSPDPQFLVTFFSRLRPNRSGRYEASFPFLSPCGRERNFLRCEDRPVVFTHLLTVDHGPPRLSYCGGGEALAVPFEPARLLPLAANGRLYHPAPEQAGGVGLVRSALAFELSACFEYGPNAPALPSHVLWQGRRLALTMDLAPLLLAARLP
ncbi:UPF0598 protein C8orf82 [Plecturocebus cupreus]